MTALTDAMVRAYGFTPPVWLTLIRSWTNDVYELVAAGEKYILKVYRGSWKRPPELEWEAELQHWLFANGAPVTDVVPLENGALFGTLRAPEGTRCFAISGHSGGTKPAPPFPPELYLDFGRASAALHEAADGFTSQLPGVKRDLTTLIDQSLQDIEPWLKDRLDDWALVRRVAATTRERIGPLKPILEWGICHGDLTFDNFDVTADGNVTIYDFDLCCYGWRAWDMCQTLDYASQERRDAFLRGYRRVRPFDSDAVAVAPYFAGADALWMMGGEISRWAEWFGTGRVHAWVDEKLEWLREWEKKQPAR